MRSGRLPGPRNLAPPLHTVFGAAHCARLTRGHMRACLGPPTSGPLSSLEPDVLSCTATHLHTPRRRLSGAEEAKGRASSVVGQARRNCETDAVIIDIKIHDGWVENLEPNRRYSSTRRVFLMQSMEGI